MGDEERCHAVEVMRYGRMSFGNTWVQADELPEKIQERLQRGAEKRVYMVVDSRANYRDVSAVLSKFGLAGVEKVSFLTN